MFSFRITLIVTMMSAHLLHCKQPPKTTDSVQFTWENIAPIPDSTGFAGSFAGNCEDGLLVAGGANFPNGGTPWNGGKKVWYNTVYLYDSLTNKWAVAGNLPQAAGYGVSISTPNGLLLIGGSNDSGHLRTVYKINCLHKKLSFTAFPSLPVPLANTCGALLGNTIYIAGGLESPDSSSTSRLFLSLNLENPGEGWKTETPWPGPNRMLSVAVTDGSAFYLFSGTQLVNGQRVYLKDAYSFSPDKGWKQLADLPQPVVAAPSPAAFLPQQGFFIFGGDDGSLAAKAAELKENHPGFSRAILHFQPENNSWKQSGTIDRQSPVTTTLVEWKGGFLLPGGEVKPGIRTTHVLNALPANK